ncbi:MAG: hypothetical protein RRY79_02085 [Clostridia bacterium]
MIIRFSETAYSALNTHDIVINNSVLIVAIMSISLPCLVKAITICATDE